MTTTARQQQKRGSATTVLRWLLVGLVVALIAAPHLLNFSGRQVIIVDGGSMSPTYEAGDVLIVTPPTGDDLKVGKILLVGTPPTAYVHRVLEISEGDTETKALLQGDANSTPDPDWITQDQVTGIPTMHISGVPAQFLVGIMTPVGILILAVFVVFVIVNPLGNRK